MRIVKVHEAKTHLSKLLGLVDAGEEIVIQRGDVPVAKLVPYGRPRSPRQAGRLAGQIVIHDDFDDPLPEFEEYTG